MGGCCKSPRALHKDHRLQLHFCGGPRALQRTIRVDADCSDGRIDIACEFRRQLAALRDLKKAAVGPWRTLAGEDADRLRAFRGDFAVTYWNN